MTTPTSSPLVRQPLQEHITFALSVLELCVENLGIQGLLNVNKIAETFFKNLLNIIFDLKLANISDGPTFPAVDIGDVSKRLCFQVTSDGKKAKVAKTLRTFAKHKIAKDYDTVRIVVIGKRQKAYDGLVIPANVGFDPKVGVIDVPDILRMLHNLKIEQLEAISQLIDKEMPLFKLASATERQTDLESLEVYRSYFDRRALYDCWTVEGDVGAFQAALADLLSLATMGIVKGIPVAKAKAKFQGQEFRSQLDRVYLKLVHLQQLYTHHERLGDIDAKTNWSNFGNRDICNAFNAYKQDVIDEMNRVLTKHGLQPLHDVMRLGEPWQR